MEAENHDLCLLLNDKLRKYTIGNDAAMIDTAKEIVRTKLKVLIKKRNPNISRDELLNTATERFHGIVEASNQYMNEEEAKKNEIIHMNEKEENKNETIHKPDCIDKSTCVCKYIPLEWKEEAKTKFHQMDLM